MTGDLRRTPSPAIPEHVRYQSQDHGGVVILDTAEGEWLALNATAGEFWRAWGGGADFEDGLRMVAARYPHVPAEALRADAERLIDEFRERKLLTDGGVPAGSSAQAEPEAAPETGGGEAVMAESAIPAGAGRPRWRRGLPAMLILLATCLVVRCCPFRIQVAVARAARRMARRPATSVEGAAIVAALDWAARRYPGRAACLEQSLAGVLLAAARGWRLDWCLGAVADPYRFHAWVEAEGRPVPALDDPRSPTGYQRVFTA